jgi:hypothetical protein
MPCSCQSSGDAVVPPCSTVATHSLMRVSWEEPAVRAGSPVGATSASSIDARLRDPNLQSGSVSVTGRRTSAGTEGELARRHPALLVSGVHNDEAPPLHVK